jgi:hypothetical protein
MKLPVIVPTTTCMRAADLVGTTSYVMVVDTVISAGIGAE